MSAAERLAYWREELAIVRATLQRDDLAFASLARPVLLEDVQRIERLIAHYEELVAAADEQKQVQRDRA